MRIWFYTQGAAGPVAASVGATLGTVSIAAASRVINTGAVSTVLDHAVAGASGGLNVSGQTPTQLGDVQILTTGTIKLRAISAVLLQSVGSDVTGAGTYPAQNAALEVALDDIQAAITGSSALSLSRILAYVEENLPVPTTEEIANAVWAHTTAADLADRLLICSKIMRNKTVTNPSTGIMTVYDDDGVTPYLTAQLYEDINETQPYRGQGAEVRRRLI